MHINMIHSNKDIIMILCIWATYWCEAPILAGIVPGYFSSTSPPPITSMITVINIF